MNVFRTIFVHSIVYKLFLIILLIYNNSYFKVFCGKCYNIYLNSYIYLSVQKYMNSTPIYKYSFLKKINEKFYYLIVNNTKWIYDAVSKTYSNSIFVNTTKQIYNDTKNDKLVIYSKIVCTFLLAFCITFSSVYGNTIVNLLYFVVAFFILVIFFANPIKRTFYNSFIYKFINKLLELEVYSEKD